MWAEIKKNEKLCIRLSRRSVADPKFDLRGAWTLSTGWGGVENNCKC